MVSANRKVLVVEDEEINLMIAEHVFSRAGFEVSTAQNGLEAIKQVEQIAFDLIFMDIEMPIMGGLEATPRIRELPHGMNVPIIALTAHSIPEKIQEFGEAGINDHMIKPIDAPKVQAIVEKYL